MRSGPLCALLWRIMIRCTNNRVTLRVRTAILGKVVEKLQNEACRRLILIAPGWPNMPWFWDLVTMSSQIPLSLPNLPNMLTQPFNQIPYRNLTNLHLHAWLLEPHADSIILMDFLHVPGSIEGGFISLPNAFKQTFGLLLQLQCC